MKTVAIMGAGGAIGSALLDHLLSNTMAETVYAFSRTPPDQKKEGVIYGTITYDEDGIKEAAAQASTSAPLDLVILATGLLHHRDHGIMPEKSLKDLTQKAFHELYQANTVVPALVAKHFLPLLPKDRRSVFAALSARVGSISDNALGGWYAYRASKAALNMILKCAAIEMRRYSPHAIVVGLHPGTVDTPLSKPFQTYVPAEKLFSPAKTARHLVDVLEGLTPDDSGHCFAWDGQRIDP